jgi:hypothetical protein
VGIVGLVGYFVAGSWPEVRAHLWLGLVAIFFATFALSFRNGHEREQERRQRAEQQRREIDAGAVECASFRAAEVVLILGEPPAFCYRLEDGRALVLRSALGGRHPDTDFDVVRLPVSHVILSCPTFGTQLPVVAELPEETDSRSRPDGEPFPIDWQALKTGGMSI